MIFLEHELNINIDTLELKMDRRTRVRLVEDCCDHLASTSVDWDSHSRRLARAIIMAVAQSKDLVYTSIPGTYKLDLEEDTIEAVKRCIAACIDLEE